MLVYHRQSDAADDTYTSMSIPEEEYLDKQRYKQATFALNHILSSFANKIYSA